MRIYISHSIRGKFGIKATKEQMTKNCKKAIKLGKWLRENFPDIIWYVPAIHDEFVSIAYIRGYMTEEQILNVDCELIKGCSALLVYSPDNYISGGMKTEIDFACKNFIPTDYVYPVDCWSDTNLPHKVGKQKIEYFIKEIQNER